MPTPGSTLSSEERPSSVEPLPLFRPEAIAALQQKFYGEIILIRPFSLMLLCWFALGISAAVLGFLFLGQYTERARVPGVMTVSDVSSPQMAAEIYVPGRWIGRLHAGSQISLRCDSCSPQFGRQIGTVLQVAETPLAQTELAQRSLDLSGQVYKIAVSLQPKAAQITQANPSPQAGVRVEAEIPLGRKPLIKWFFERSGS
jgi:hypothetical protein